MNKLLLVGIIFGIIFSAGCTVNEVTDKDKFLVDKEKNMCEIDSDCEYIWFTGGCNTPEYVAKIMKDCDEGIGPCPAAALEREGVTCSCENNRCITHG